jgi:hypothetical protein
MENTIKRYVLVDAEGWAVNTILWDGITPLSIQGMEIVEESECTALPIPSPPPEEIPE